MDQTFPWLSQIAMAFTEYKWRGLIFTYKTTSSDLVTSTNPSLGTVMMATDYNAAEEPFSDKRAMNNYEFTTTSKPSISFIHGVETDRNQTAHPTLFVRDSPPPPNADIRLYDIGQFCIATQGMQTTVPEATIGELWCSYEIEFLKPRFDVDAGLEFDSYLIGGPSTPFPMGQEHLWTYEGNLGGTLKDFGGNRIRYTFPPDSSDKTFNIYILNQNSVQSVNALTFYAVKASHNVTRFNSGPYTGIEAYNNSSTSDNALWSNLYFRCHNIQSSNDLPWVEFGLDVDDANRLPSGDLLRNYFQVTECNRAQPMVLRK